MTQPTCFFKRKEKKKKIPSCNCEKFEAPLPHLHMVADAWFEERGRTARLGKFQSAFNSYTSNCRADANLLFQLLK